MEFTHIEWLSAAGYFVFVLFILRRLHVSFQHKCAIDVMETRRYFNSLQQKKREIDEEKVNFAEEAQDIFNLYDMTKEITKNFSEEDSIRIFKGKLSNSIRSEECRFVLPDAEEMKNIQETPEVSVIPLIAQQQLLGYLLIKGCSPEELEKATILAHQLALVIRRDRLYRQVESLAITDSLTGVHTRRYIMERFQEELARARSQKIPISFLMIDVDYFKHFNDQYGHLTGDQILRNVASLIQDNIREIDTIGRYGGEEFCVILPDADGSGAQYVAERMRHAVEKSVVKAYDAKVRLTISIGVACYPADGKKVPELIDKADWALYRAKKMGRNKVCVFGIYDEKD
jgi:diguanylate cyclase (GGDEF)-like protein